jgi:hypothetical protein
VSGNTYCYRVSAVDSTGFESALSYAAAVTVGGLPPPVAPSNLRITGYTASVVDLTWTDNSINEDEFDIERMVGSGGTWSYYDFVSANDTTYTDNSVSQGVTYYYRVRSYNSTGGSSTPSNEVFLTIPTGDFTPPDIYDYTDISNPVVVNNGTAPTITINATPYDDSGISSFDLQYVKMGDLSPSGWTSSMNISGSTFIRNGFATGVSYRLRAVDIYNNVRITDWKAFTVRSGSPVTAQSDQPSAGGLSSDLRWQAYRIVSVPYVLDDKRPSSFLPNCLGGDHRDQDVIYSRWRFLRYTNRFLEDYDSFQNQDAVMPGLGFFLIVRDGGFHLSAGSGTVADQETFGKNSGVPVDSGWNLVGNPYCVGVPVDSMFFIREGNSAPESIMQTAYFSGGGSGGWDFTPANANSLRPWQGLAMKFAARGRLYIKAPGAPIVLPKQMAPNVIARIAAPLQQDAMNWTLPIDAERIDNALQCKGSAIGMVRDAKDGDDNYDLYMPPFIGGSNLIVYFNNQNEDMLRDIRPLNDEGSVWEMHVMTGDEGAKVRLQLPEKLNLPNSEFEAYLIDIDQKMAHNLKTTSTVEINSGNGNRTFRVVVGKRSFVEQNNAGVKLAPSEIKLYTNYPNPFNPETTIRYTIPDALTSYFVTMKIFNMLGQEIATLVNEQQTPGYYEVKWNAHGYSSGIYFYQMSVSNGSNKAFRDIKKMVLMK